MIVLSAAGFDRLAKALQSIALDLLPQISGRPGIVQIVGLFAGGNEPFQLLVEVLDENEMRRRRLRHAVVEIDEMLAARRDGESVEPRGSDASFEEHDGAVEDELPLGLDRPGSKVGHFASK